MRLPEYIFDLIYDKRCKTCTNHTIRVHINKLLHKMYKGDKIDGKKITFVYVRKEYDKFGVTPPSLPSVVRHYENHMKYYLDHPSEIKEKWKQEQRERYKAPMVAVENEITAQNREGSDEATEINQLMRAVSDKELKIYDAFPIRGYNSQTGENGPLLTWDQWTRKFLTIKVKTPHGYIRKPMTLAKHQIDLLNLMDSDNMEGLQLLISRNHRKSTTLEVYSLRNLCDYQSRILYISGSKDEVVRYTENIRSTLKSNARILYYYGYLPSIIKGNSQKGVYLRSLINGIISEPDFDKDANLSFATSPKANSGSSKLGAHPDIIIIDDMQGEEVEMYDNIKRKHEKWFDRNIMPMRNAGTILIIAGTRKAEDDIYDYIMRKNMLFTIQKPAILEFPNDEQEEPMNEDELSDSKWSYYYEDRVRTIGEEKITNTFLVGVKNLKGGKVFWDEFRIDNWDNRPIQYRKANGQYNKTLMALQELLLEKGFLEAKAEQGGFSFSAEYQLNPKESKGKHFKKDRIQYYSLNKWRKIVQNKQILKFTWIDVGYSLKMNEKATKRRGFKSGKTAFATICRIEGDEKGFLPSDAGIYVIDIRSGNYYLKNADPEKSLIGEMLKVYEAYKPQMFCFEDNFFGMYVRVNMQMFDDFDLPVDGKTNNLDKNARISIGINALLAQPKDIGGLYLCRDANGFNALLKQLTDFPYTRKIDELDAVESCHRLLIQGNAKLEIIGDLYANEEHFAIECKECPLYDKATDKCKKLNQKISEILSCPKRKGRGSVNRMKNPINVRMGGNPMAGAMRSYRGRY